MFPKERLAPPERERWRDYIRLLKEPSLNLIWMASPCRLIAVRHQPDFDGLLRRQVKNLPGDGVNLPTAAHAGARRSPGLVQTRYAELLEQDMTGQIRLIYESLQLAGRV